jgi:hypothetical protein
MALPANPTTPSSPFQSPSDWFAEHTQRNHRNTPHGQKRRIDDDADTAPTISSGFKKLRISPPRRTRQHDCTQPTNVDLHYAYQRTSSPTSAYQAPAVTSDHNLTDAPIHHESLQSAIHHPQPLKYRNGLVPESQTCDTPPPQHLPPDHSDFMPVEDNRHRIFISDLDAAIAEIEAEERAAREKEQERSFFLTDDVDKEVSGIPEQVLRNSGTDSATLKSPAPSQALVLYRDPLSLTVPEEVDAVRRAVHEARQRIRERHVEDGSATGLAVLATQPVSEMEQEGFGYPLDRQQAEWRHNSDASAASEFDPDAMEIE